MVVSSLTWVYWGSAAFEVLGWASASSLQFMSWGRRREFGEAVRSRGLGALIYCRDAEIVFWRDRARADRSR